MYNYGTGCNYNYGGYIGGYGYGGYAPVAYQVPTTNGRGHNFALILVLFILLAIIGCCGGFGGNNTGCGFGFYIFLCKLIESSKMINKKY